MFPNDYCVSRILLEARCGLARLETKRQLIKVLQVVMFGSPDSHSLTGFRFVLVMCALALVSVSAFALTPRAQNNSTQSSPSDTVIKFYKAMRERRFRQAFAISIYQPAIEGLSQEDFEDLQPDFDKMAANIPEKIEITGEQITGNIATVMVKVPHGDDPEKATIEPVTLIRAGNAWLVGDEANQAIVKRAGKKFFLDARIDAHHSEVEELLKRVLAVEVVYSQQHSGMFVDLPALIRAGLMPQDLSGTDSTGYRFHITVAKDGRTYVAGAEPARYGRTGKLSFWMDQTGVIKGADRGGKPITAPQ